MIALMAVLEGGDCFAEAAPIVAREHSSGTRVRADKGYNDQGLSQTGR